MMPNPTREPADTDLPPTLAAPARRALAQAGYLRLEQLRQVRESDLRPLHGMGPKAIEHLRRALATHGWSFADEAAP
jgi:hypothetical protein